MKSIVNPDLYASSITSIKSLVNTSLRIENSVSFFDVPLVSQQTVNFNINSITTALTNYGFIQSNGQSGSIISVEQLSAYAETGLQPDQGYGFSVALSSDGNRMAVGGCGIYYDGFLYTPFQEFSPPYEFATVFIYTRTNSTWSLEGSFNIPGFGNYVSLSSDGNVLAVGSYQIDSAYIYRRINGVWELEESFTDIFELVLYGVSVSLSGDGNTLVVSDSSGKIVVYTYFNEIWSKYGDTLDANFNDIGFPYTNPCVISEDGSTFACANYGADGNEGAIKIFIKDEFGDWVVQGPELKSPDGDETCREGYSAALSANGNILITGAPFFGSFSRDGKAFHYERTGTTWSYIGELPITDNFDSLFGSSVSISGDGNAVCVGGYGDRGEIGAVWLYYRNGPSYALRSKILGTGETLFCLKGFSSYMSSDASTLVFSAPAFNFNDGAIWVYINPNIDSEIIPLPKTNKTLLSDKLFNSFTCENMYTNALLIKNKVSFFGVKPIEQQSISPTINSLVNLLQKYGLSSINNTWNLDQTPLVGTNSVGITPSLQGTSVAISFDGQTSIVGGPGSNAFNVLGGIWVFIKLRGNWFQQIGPLTSLEGDGYGDQGYSVSTTTDGNLAAVGAICTESIETTGAVFVYKRIGNNWILQQGPIVGSSVSTVPREGQGHSVSLSSLGDYMLYTGNTHTFVEGNVGAFWIWSRSGDVWSEVVGPINPDTSTLNFGFSGKMSGDGLTVVIGDPDYENTGAIWIYRSNGGLWDDVSGPFTQLPSLGDDSNQGYSVAISYDGRTIATGSPTDYNQRGAVYIYYRNDSNVWELQAGPIVGSSPTFSSKQGTSVSLSNDGNTLVIGGSGNNSNVGAVWTFKRTGNIWTQSGVQLVLSSEDPVEFGSSVAISSDGNNIIVGSPIYDSGIGCVFNATLNN